MINNNVSSKNYRKIIIMPYLYKKTHNITGLKYLGKTKKDPFKYKGSGIYWKSHIKKHGNNVSTEILKECILIEELRYWGEYYSDLWDIVNSEEWANLKPEIGDGGSPKGINLGRKNTEEMKRRMSEIKKGIPAPWAQIPKTVEQKEHLSKINLGKKLSKETIEKRLQTRINNGNLNHTEETKKKMRRPKTEQTKINMKTAQKERRDLEGEIIWITDGKNNTTIPISSKIPDNWYRGKTTDQIPPSQRGKFWINDGIKNTMSLTIPDGWVRGRINYSRRKI